jgi:PIN domain nuclease of toxin-antitoxin system
MIVLDTYGWIWWVHGDDRLTSTQAEMITIHSCTGAVIAIQTQHACATVDPMGPAQ